ncbi:MAG: DUF1573 domain-containing protein [Bacteroidales bacterium]
MTHPRLLFTAICLLLAGCIGAQTRTPMMSFENTSHDFGKIKEADGPASWKFVFTNTGAIPLVITNVTASCGCTSPAWSKEPVLPGATGFVSATYDPRDRPGIFEKTVTVTSNGEPPVVILKISGDVVPKGNPVDQQFKATAGDLKMKTSHVGFGEIFINSTKTIETPVYNAGTVPLQISFSNVPGHLTVVAKPSTVAPGSMAMISVTYDPNLKKAWGYVADRIGILLNGSAPKANNLTISATISEDFSKYTEKEKAQAPVINFGNDTYNFGSVKAGTPVVYEFEYSNKGKSDLIIHDVTVSCGCTAANSSAKSVSPGQSGRISVKFDTSGRSGEQNKTITVISNDPGHPRMVLWVKGVVIN